MFRFSSHGDPGVEKTKLGTNDFFERSRISFNKFRMSAGIKLKNNSKRDTYFMMKKIILLSIVINSGIAFGFGLRSNPQYNNAALNSAHQEIQELMNLPASEFARRRGTETDVVKYFEKTILTNAAEDEPISKER